MPNVLQVLKAEITRLARKEARALIMPLRRPSVKTRKFVADLKRRMASLERSNRELMARLARVERANPTPPAQPDKRGWISGKGILSLRKKLGLSQADFARLVGVSSISVYQWERKAKTLTLRGATKSKVFVVRGIGAREAKRRLTEMDNRKPVKMVRKSSKHVAKRTKKA